MSASEEPQAQTPDEALAAALAIRTGLGLEASVRAVRVAEASATSICHPLLSRGVPLLPAEYASVVEKRRTRTHYGPVVGQRVAEVVPDEIFGGRYFSWMGDVGTWQIGIVGDPAMWFQRLSDSFAEAHRIATFEARYPLRLLEATAASIKADLEIRATNVTIDVCGSRVLASLLPADLQLSPPDPQLEREFERRFGPVAELVPIRRGRHL